MNPLTIQHNQGLPNRQYHHYWYEYIDILHRDGPGVNQGFVLRFAGMGKLLIKARGETYF